jgi:hypothetical protein
MSSGNHMIYSAAAGGRSGDARAITRSAYARLAMASTLDLHDGLLDVWHRAPDKPAPDFPKLPSQFLRAVARAAKASFAFSVNVARHLEQASIARERAELRYPVAPRAYPGSLIGAR